jgi:hypothetical protein
MSNFLLELNAMGGADLDDCAKDAVAIANKLNIIVSFMFNRVNCLACPGDDAQKLSEAALTLIGKPQSFTTKIATGH